jgi:hypothetical protein
LNPLPDVDDLTQVSFGKYQTRLEEALRKFPQTVVQGGCTKGTRRRKSFCVNGFATRSKNTPNILAPTFCENQRGAAIPLRTLRRPNKDSDIEPSSKLGQEFSSRFRVPGIAGGLQTGNSFGDLGSITCLFSGKMASQLSLAITKVD